MRPLLVLCVIALISLTGFAGSIPFSGSGGNGNLQTGQPFAYDADGGTFAHDWSIPGVNFGTAIWSGPTVVGFLVIFELPTGVIIDDAQVTIGNGADCLGSSIGGTTFCAGPYSAPWAVTMVGRNDILFYSSGDLLTNGDSFFVDIFFTGGTRMARPSAESLFLYPSPRVESWLARESSHS